MPLKAFALPSLALQLLMVLLSLGYAARGAFVDDLPGWMGETHTIRTKAKTSSLVQRGKEAVKFDPTRVIQVSWNPRAFLYKGFLSDEECNHLMNLARDKLQKSMVADNESGKSVLSEIRTSSGMFIDKGKDDIVAGIEDRIAAWTFLPKENGEAMQVLKYEHGEKYEPHYDYFHDTVNQKLGGHRVATVLLYLSNVGRGGETVFPKAQDAQTKDDTWSECSKKGIAVKPEKGNALLFFSLSPDGIPDSNSLHGGCPVVEGEKWSATKWIHVNSFDLPRRDPNVCEDENERCVEWAAFGECKKNPIYMVGTHTNPGSCRKSCKVC